MNRKVLIIVCSIIVLVLSISLILILTNDKKAKIYNVSFETKGGTNISDQTVEAGEKVIKPKDPEKEGYIFIEWLYKGKTYDFSNVVKSDLVLTAKYSEKVEGIETFVVKFNSDGGTTIPNQIIAKGNKVTIPPIPTKEDYIFVEWQYNGAKYNFETIIESDLELVAKWKKMETPKPPTNGSGSSSNNNTSTNKPAKKEYTVTFNSNGGSNVSNKKVVEGNKVTKPENPTKTNYMFNGWFLGGSLYNFNNSITSNITLLANWALYGDVSQDGILDSLDLIMISKYISGTQGLNEVQKKLADVNLDGLINTIDSDILSKYTTDKVGYGIQYLPYNSGKSYQIAYKLNGGIINQPNINVYAQISLPYTLKNPTKENCIFLGWSGSNGTVPKLEVTIPKNTTGNLNYSANWALYGDVSQDGILDSLDLIMISKYISGTQNLNEVQKKLADVNLDSKIDEKDSDILGKYMTDKEGYGIPKLPHIS